MSNGAPSVTMKPEQPSVSRQNVRSSTSLPWLFERSAATPSTMMSKPNQSADGLYTVMMTKLHGKYGGRGGDAGGDGGSGTGGEGGGEGGGGAGGWGGGRSQVEQP